MSLDDGKIVSETMVEDLIIDAKLLLKNTKRAKKILADINQDNIDDKLVELESLLGNGQYKYIILDGDVE